MDTVFNSTGHRLELPEIVSAEGIHLTDGAGNRFVDFTSGVWCTAVGHGNARVNAAIKSQIDAITHAGFCYSHPVVEEAAAALLAVCGLEDGAVVFLCSGSEGIDYARQVAKAITGRTRSLTFHDAYLGSLSSAIDRGGDWSIIDWEVCDSCPDRRRAADCDHLEIPADVAEFIFEPGSSSGQVRFAPAPVVQRVVAQAKATGGRVIVNEVTTGVGRTGSWFGLDHYGIEPDLIVIGKGIGNGYPVSAVVMNRQTTDELAATDFKYMQSHQNDPLGAAVVKEVIATIEDEGLIARARKNGEVLLAALQGLLCYQVVRDVRGRGLMFAIDLRDAASASAAFHALLDRGYIVCLRGDTLRIDPPLITSRDELLAFAEVLAQVLLLHGEPK